jgi:hypothetical protein
MIGVNAAKDATSHVPQKILCLAPKIGDVSNAVISTTLEDLSATVVRLPVTKNETLNIYILITPLKSFLEDVYFYLLL